MSNVMEYVLVRGKYRRPDGTPVKHNETVKLNADQAAAFSDMFVLKSVREAELVALQAQTEAQTDDKAPTKLTSKRAC